MKLIKIDTTDIHVWRGIEDNFYNEDGSLKQGVLAVFELGHLPAPAEAGINNYPELSWDVLTEDTFDHSAVTSHLRSGKPIIHRIDGIEYDIINA